MPDTSFWREAENRFRRLQTPPPQPGEVQHDSHNGLQANWSRDGWSDSGKPWYLSNADDAIKKLFTWAAESATVELGHPGGEEALFFWLDLLRRDSPFFMPFGVGGYIYRLCDASAEYCIKCETDAKAQRREGKGGGEQAGIAERASTVVRAAEVQAPGEADQRSPNETLTIPAIMKALDSDQPKEAVRLRIEMEGCAVKTLWSEAFESRRAAEKTKQTAFNRWQASRHDQPSWADGLMRARLLQPKSTAS